MQTRFLGSLVEGDFGVAGILRESLTEGDFWALIGGGMLLYRGDNQFDQIDYAAAVGAAYGPGSFDVPSDQVHADGSRTVYALRRVSGSGLEEMGTEATAALRLDSQGQQILPGIGVVRELRVRQAGADGALLSWLYWPVGQATRPVHFAVYSDGGTGTMDWNTPLVTVAFGATPVCQQKVPIGVTSGVVRVAVRAVDRVGLEGEAATASVSMTSQPIMQLGSIDVQVR